GTNLPTLWILRPARCERSPHEAVEARRTAMGLRGMRRSVQTFLVLLMAVACSGPVSSPGSAPVAGDAPQAPPQRKAITIALQAEVNALAAAANQVGINSNPSRFFHEFVNAYVTFRDQNNDVRPWIAAELPAVDAGSGARNWRSKRMTSTSSAGPRSTG